MFGSPISHSRLCQVLTLWWAPFEISMRISHQGPLDNRKAGLEPVLETVKAIAFVSGCT